MAEEIRKLTVAKGYDPRAFTVFAYGGAGPVHAGAVARELDLTTVVVPMADVASLWSAFGAATSDLGVTVELSINETEPFDTRRLMAARETLRERARATLAQTGTEDGAAFAYSAGMRYRAQVNEVWVAIAGTLTSDEDVERLVQQFESEYEALFGQGTGYRAAGIEIAALRCVATIRRPVTFTGSLVVGQGVGAADGEREVFWEEHRAFLPTRVVRGESLSQHTDVIGPTIIELDHTAAVVHPGQRIRRDQFGNLVIRADAAADRGQPLKRPERAGVVTARSAITTQAGDLER
jgi:N-methylhydantoinase A